MKKNSDLKLYLDIFYYVIAYGTFIISAIYYIYIIATRIDYLLNSDASSEMVLARLVFNDKSILVHDWHYSSELRIIYMQLFMAPLFLFTSNWHIVRVIATFTMATVFMLSLFFFMSSIQLKKFFPVVATYLLLPTMPNFFWHVLLFLFYNINVTCSLFILGLFFYIRRTKSKKKQHLLISILTILSFITGLCGIRNLVNIFISAGISVFLLWILGLKNENNSQKNKSSLLFLIICVIGMAGTGIYMLLTKIYFIDGAFGYQSNLKLTFNPQALFITWCGFLQTLNLPSNTFTTVIILTSFLTLVILTIKRNSPLKYHEKFLVFYMGIYILIYIFIYSFTDMFYSERYFVQISTFFPVIAIIFFSKLGVKKQWLQYIKIMCLSIFGVIMFSTTLHNFYYIYTNIDITRDYRAVTQTLLQNECYDGYVINYYLKRGSEITELSSGKINVRPYFTDPSMADPKITNIDIPLNWLTSDRQCASKPEGKIFVVFGDYEYENYQIASFFTDLDYLVFDDYGVKLFIYDSYDEMVSVTGVEHKF